MRPWALLVLAAAAGPALAQAPDGYGTLPDGQDSSAALALAPAPEGRYAMLPDGQQGLWVVDGADGRIARCRQGGARAPRVIDVIGGNAVARPRDGAGSEPICTAWVTIAAPERTFRPHVVGTGG